MGRPLEWDYKQRENLSFLLKQGYIMKEILEILHCTRPKLVAELKRGLEEEDYKKRRYIKYSPLLAMECCAIEVFGEEGFKALVEYEHGKK